MVCQRINVVVSQPLNGRSENLGRVVILLVICVEGRKDLRNHITAVNEVEARG